MGINDGRGDGSTYGAFIAQSQPGPLGFDILEDGDGERQRERMYEADCAEEQGMSVAQYREFLAKERAKDAARQAMYASPAWQRQQVEAAKKCKSQDAAVAHAAFAAWGCEPCKCHIQYWGDVEAVVSARGRETVCIDTKTLEIRRKGQ